MRKRMLTLYHNETGATSILIIFMMIVFVTLGTFSITSAHVNLKFGKKAAGMNKIYYALDMAGEQYIADLDCVLAEVQAEALADMRTQGYTAQVFNEIYLSLANQRLSALKEKYAGSTVKPITGDDGAITGLSAGTSIPSAEDADTSLEISVLIRPPTLDRDAVSGEITGRLKTGEQRFVIDLWRQRRTPFEYDAASELWDGIWGE